MLENIRLAFRGIWSHKMRSFLTMLGIIIGIAAIIAIVSIIQGANEQIKENLIGSGDHTVDVQLYQSDWTYEYDYSPLPEGVGTINQEILDQIKDIDHVEGVAPYHFRSVYDGVNYGKNNLTGGYIYGIGEDYLGVCGYSIMRGRGFTEKDVAGIKKVAIIDENLANTLFEGDDPLGRSIEIKGEPFVVIGIAAKSSAFEPVISTIDDYYTYSVETGGNIFVPDVTWPIIYNFDEPENVRISVSSVDDMTQVGKDAAAVLNSYINPVDDTVSYKANDLLEQAKEIQQLGQSTNMMLIWIAAISLLVGGIGVMNIMLVSVTERTNEIGLKRAIGARKNKIMFQFLTEAVVLTSLGGILGVITGIILAEVISAITSTPVAISVPAAVGAVIFSMAIGIIFGILPSRKAANLNPIDALRHE